MGKILKERSSDTWFISYLFIYSGLYHFITHNCQRLIYNCIFIITIHETIFRRRANEHNPGRIFGQLALHFIVNSKPFVIVHRIFDYFISYRL